jgi:hypothetical protein
MQADDKAAGDAVSDRAAPKMGGWLRHRLPDWPRIWGACLRRTRSWPVPPRWTRRDWREELEAEGIVAASAAIRDFDPSLGPTLGSFVYHRILSHALTRHRRECGFALCGHPGLAGQGVSSPSGEGTLATDDDGERR